VACLRSADGPVISPDWLTAVGAVGQAFALGGTAVMGWRGITAWRAQLVGKRHIEIAEQALVATYRIRDAFEFIRSPMTGSHEKLPRQRDDRESSEESKLLDSYFVPVERVNDAAEAFAEFQMARLLCQVHFAAQSIEPFDRIMALRARVLAGARKLRDSVREGDRGDWKDAGLRRAWESSIWHEGDADEITVIINAAVAEIEQICGRHLR
jgi:hypothetical protein